MEPTEDICTTPQPKNCRLARLGAVPGGTNQTKQARWPGQEAAGGPIAKYSLRSGGTRGRKEMLAGDLITGALRRLGSSFTFDIDAPPIALSEFDQGGTDPGNIVEFLAFDLDFRVEPTTGVIFPSEVDHG